jgi:aspartyl-tRNA synthetase
MELADVSSIFASSKFAIFSQAVARGGVIKALNAKGLATLTRAEMGRLEEGARAMGAAGLAYLKVEHGVWKSPLEKFLSPTEREALAEKLRLEDGDLVLFAADTWTRACTILGRVRLDCAALARARGILPAPTRPFHLLWVTDFPLLTYDAEEKRHVATHHPFTAPVEEDAHLLHSTPAAVRGQHYDLVMNGVELGGGSIRVHNPELQRQIFEDLLKIPPEVVENRFGYMLRAFRYGAPPHGGIALGLDRFAAMLCGTDSIRDVIAFPKTQRGVDPMVQSPSSASERQLKELSIRPA